ncbi:hypothetical protein KPH14_008205 [Odynerus spinipes]|uniref:Uncharacterized protein n=1 Tax=Odynerus spinipes TaxID=1348599 RepID=A0AAD9RGA4_9HYME|nr:hypothetical protein KPH14_008205 [Odynerus spinipes]
MYFPSRNVLLFSLPSSSDAAIDLKSNACPPRLSCQERSQSVASELRGNTKEKDNCVYLADDAELELKTPWCYPIFSAPMKRA